MNPNLISPLLVPLVVAEGFLIGAVLGAAVVGGLIAVTLALAFSVYAGYQRAKAEAAAADQLLAGFTQAMEQAQSEGPEQKDPDISGLPIVGGGRAG
jgi:uncharacterized membrane protein YebE (DUF533 family)